MALKPWTWKLSLLVLLFSCSATPPAKETRMTQKTEVLEAQVLHDCVELGGSVALVRVLEVKASNAGTRGARVRVEFELEQVLRGQVPRQAGFWAWGGAAAVHSGQRLMVALKPAPPEAKDVALLGFVPVGDGQQAESIRLHQQALGEKTGAAL